MAILVIANFTIRATLWSLTQVGVTLGGVEERSGGSIMRGVQRMCESCTQVGKAAVFV